MTNASTPTGSYRDAFRALKASKLVLCLAQHGITAADAAHMQAAHWLLAAAAAAVRPPSPETQALVIRLLSAGRHAGNPFPKS